MNIEIVPGVMAQIIEPTHITKPPSNEFEQLKQLVSNAETPIFERNSQYKDHITTKWEQRKSVSIDSINKIPLDVPVIIVNSPNTISDAEALNRLENVYQVITPDTTTIYRLASDIYMDARQVPTLEIPGTASLYYGKTRINKKMITSLWSEHQYDVRSFKIYDPPVVDNLIANFPGYIPHVMTVLAYDLSNRFNTEPVFVNCNTYSLPVVDQQNLKQFSFI